MRAYGSETDPMHCNDENIVTACHDFLTILCRKVCIRFTGSILSKKWILMNFDGIDFKSQLEFVFFSSLVPFSSVHWILTWTKFNRWLYRKRKKLRRCGWFVSKDQNILSDDHWSLHLKVALFTCDIGWQFVIHGLPTSFGRILRNREIFPLSSAASVLWECNQDLIILSIGEKEKHVYVPEEYRVICTCQSSLASNISHYCFVCHRSRSNEKHTVKMCFTFKNYSQLSLKTSGRLQEGVVVW